MSRSPNSTRSLSSAESKVVLGLAEEARRELTRREVIERFELAERTANDVIPSLVRKGWLARTGRGRYLLIPPEWGATPIGESNTLALASRVTPDGYIAFSTAAAHWGLTTQQRSVVWVVTRTHTRDRRMNDSDVRFVRLPSKAFFGFGPVEVFGFPVPMSDLEKTVIDCLLQPERAGGLPEASAVLVKASRRWDWEKAVGYLERLGNTALVQKLGFLCDAALLPIPDAMRQRLRLRIKHTSRTYLVPRSKGTVPPKYDAAWGVVVNVDPAMLFRN